MLVYEPIYYYVYRAFVICLQIFVYLSTIAQIINNSRYVVYIIKVENLTEEDKDEKKEKTTRKKPNTISMRLTQKEKELFDEMGGYLAKSGRIEKKTNDATMRYAFFSTARDIIGGMNIDEQTE